MLKKSVYNFIGAKKNVVKIYKKLKKNIKECIKKAPEGNVPKIYICWVKRARYKYCTLLEIQKSTKSEARSRFQKVA